MEFKEIKGDQHIVLEPNEKVYITTLGEYNTVKITNGGSGLEIVGNSSIVHSIRGKGMLEKVYIPPVVSSKEIIEKCDKWLETFKKVHDRLKDIATNLECMKERISMSLYFTKSFSFSDTNTGRTVELNLENTRTGKHVQEGVSIVINENNKAVYDYLVANVLDYYITKNYGSTKIGEWNATIYSDPKYIHRTLYPMSATLNSLDSSLLDCSDIVSTIIKNHDSGISSQSFIDELRSKISDQQIDDRMDNDIHHSEAVCEDMMSQKSALEQALSLTKKLKK